MSLPWLSFFYPKSSLLSFPWYASHSCCFQIRGSIFPQSPFCIQLIFYFLSGLICWSTLSWLTFRLQHLMYSVALWYTVRHPLLRDFSFCFWWEVQATNWAAQQLQCEPANRQTMSKILNKISRLRGWHSLYKGECAYLSARYTLLCFN